MTILSCCIGVKVVSSKKDRKALMITFDVLYTPPRNHLINVLYIEVKNFELLFRSAAKDPSLCLQIEIHNLDVSEIIT